MRLFLYTPSPKLGGTETLALRIAEELSRRSITTILVTEHGGWLQINASQVGLETLTPHKFSLIRVEEADVIIASAKYLFDVSLRGREEQTVFWILHPLEFVWTAYKRIFRIYEYLQAKNSGLAFQLSSPGRFKKLKNKLSRLTESGRIVSMSKDCTDFTNRFLRSSCDIPTLPLPIPRCNADFGNQASNQEIRGIAYFGRIEHFKVASIKRLISDYSQSRIWQNQTLILFGFGAAEDEVRGFAKRRGVSIEITGKVIAGDVVKRARTDGLLVFTMGLSGLDLLSANVPAVFLPVPRSAHDKDGNYAFLSHLPEGCLGSYPEFLDDSRGNTFSEITEICQDGRIWSILRKDKDRISQQHDTATAVDRLLKIAATI